MEQQFKATITTDALGLINALDAAHKAALDRLG